MQKHNVRLVGLGLGYHSLPDMISKGTWNGKPLYIDLDKAFYKKLSLGVGSLAQLATSRVLAKHKEATEAGVGSTSDTTDGQVSFPIFLAIFPHYFSNFSHISPIFSHIFEFFEEKFVFFKKFVFFVVFLIFF